MPTIAVRVRERSTAENSDRLGRSVTRAVLATLFLLFGWLAISSSLRQSPTIDEPVHLLGGYSYLRWRDYRINPEHPPLVKMWAALPLLWLDVADPRAAATWSEILKTEPGGAVYPLAQAMFFQSSDAAKVFFFGKLQMLVLSSVLALFVFIWARRLLGVPAGLAAIFAYALDPNILAHSMIIHTDLPFAAAVFIGCYFFCRALQRLTWLDGSLAALLFGLAVVTKHSFIALMLIWLMLGMIKIFSREPWELALFTPSRSMATRRAKLFSLCAIFIAAGVVAYGAIWAVYGFRFNAVPGGGSPLFLTRLPERAVVESVKSSILTHRLLPEALVAGVLYNLKIWKHAAYLWGQVSEDGFWSYFPIAFAVKTPLPTLILLAASLLLFWRKKTWRAQILLLVPAAIYFTLAVLSRFNIGIRHLLPIYPFLFVLIGGAAAEFWRSGGRAARSALAMLGLWYVGSAVYVYPDYLAYFNELAGGPRGGHKILIDSNLDWGQDLKGLKPWLDRNGGAQAQLIYFGSADAKYYGIEDFYSAENLAQRDRTGVENIELPPYLVISANFLYGGAIFLPEDLAARLARYRMVAPAAAIGHSLLVFRVDPADARVYADAAAISERKGTFNLAAVLLRKSVQLDPADADVRFQLGGVLAQQKKFPEALAQLREAVRLKPDFAAGYFNLGRVAAAEGRLEEAVANFRESMRLRPQDAEAHESLARTLARQGKVDEARLHFQEAVRLLKKGR